METIEEFFAETIKSLNLELAFDDFETEIEKAFFAQINRVMDARKRGMAIPVISGSMESIHWEAIKEDFSNGVLNGKRLKDSIQRTLDNSETTLYGCKFVTTDQNGNEYKRYFMLATLDGLFFFAANKIAFIKYELLHSVIKTSCALIVSAEKVEWFTEHGVPQTDTKAIVIKENDENKDYLEAIEKGIQYIIKRDEDTNDSEEDLSGDLFSDTKATKSANTEHLKKVDLLRKYSKQIKTGFAFDSAGYINAYRVSNAKKIFAEGLNEESVIGFYDTSLNHNGSNGYLFTDTKVYYLETGGKPQIINYDEIKNIGLTLRGKKDYNNELKFELADGTVKIWKSIFLNKTPLFEFFNELLKLDTVGYVDEKKPDKEENFESIQSIADKKDSFVSDDFFPAGIKIDKTKIFPMVVMATMSSGKSTLINALLGKEILPSSNEACTALTYSILDDDADSKEIICTTDTKGSVKVYETNLAEELYRINSSPDITDVFIRSHVNGVLNTDKALLIIDTPGPNNSRDESHQNILFNTMEKIKGGLFLYVLNATQLGINDDKKLMLTLKTITKKNPKIKVLFVLNKVDQLDEEQESVEEFVKIASDYIKEQGFSNPEIIPISARAAILFKKVLEGEKLTRLEYRDFCNLYELYKSTDFNMRKYALTEELKNQSKEIEVHGRKYTVGNLNQAIENTGISLVEEYIQRVQILSSGYSKTEFDVKKT